MKISLRRKVDTRRESAVIIGVFPNVMKLIDPENDVAIDRVVRDDIFKGVGDGGSPFIEIGLSLIILMVGLWIAVSYLKNNKVSAYIAALVVMPIYGTSVVFGNIFIYTDGITLHDNFWPVGLGYIWYIIGAIIVIEAAAYEVVSLVKGKENPKFSPSANAESAAFLLAGAAVCFAIAGAKYTLDFWGLFLGVLSEIAFVEASAEALYLYREVETK